MYRCEICREPSKPGEDRLVHCLYREDKSIAREVSVCATCKRSLTEHGIPYPVLVARHLTQPTPAPFYQEGLPKQYANLPRKTMVYTEEGTKVVENPPPVKGKTKKQRKLAALQADSVPVVVNKPLSLGKPVSLFGERVEAPNGVK